MAIRREVQPSREDCDAVCSSGEESGRTPPIKRSVFGARALAEAGSATVRELLELLYRLLAQHELKVTLQVLDDWVEEPFAASALLVHKSSLLSAIVSHGGTNLCEQITRSCSGAEKVGKAGCSEPSSPGFGREHRPWHSQAHEVAVPSLATALYVPETTPPPPCLPVPPPFLLEEWEDAGYSSSDQRKSNLKKSPRIEDTDASIREPKGELEKAKNCNASQVCKKGKVADEADTAKETKKAEGDFFTGKCSDPTNVTDWYGNPNNANHLPKAAGQRKSTDTDAADRKSKINEAKTACKKIDLASQNAKTSFYAAKRMRKNGNCIQKMALHPLFENICGLVIFTHAAVIGLYVQHQATVAGDVHWSLKGAQFSLTIIFLFEVVIKIYAEQREYFVGFEWKWNCFDCVILLMVMVELLSYLITARSPGLKKLAQLGEMMRIARVLRIVKFLRLSPTLRVITSKILASMSALSWVLVLVFLLLYVAAVCIAHGAHEFLIVKHHQYVVFNGNASDIQDSLDPLEMAIFNDFGSVAKAFYTLFQAITGGEPWGPFADNLSNMSHFYFAIFVFYIALVIFGVLNTVNGIFVDVSIMSRQQQREQILLMEQAIEKSIEDGLREAFFEVDEDETGSLTFDKLEAMVKDDNQVQMFLQHLKIDTSDTRKLFQVLDVDGNQEIELDEFVKGIMKIKGEATGLDILRLNKKLEKLERYLITMLPPAVRGTTRMQTGWLNNESS